MGSNSSKRKHKNGKYKKIENSLENKEKKKNNSKIGNSLENKEKEYFDVSKIELRTKIFSVGENVESKLTIFPNGNILIHDEENIKIFDKKKLKPIFTFSIIDLYDVIILSNKFY